MGMSGNVAVSIRYETSLPLGVWTVTAGLGEYLDTKALRGPGQNGVYSSIMASHGCCGLLGVVRPLEDRIIVSVIFDFSRRREECHLLLYYA